MSCLEVTQVSNGTTETQTHTFSTSEIWLRPSTQEPPSSLAWTMMVLLVLELLVPIVRASQD